MGHIKTLFVTPNMLCMKKKIQIFLMIEIIQTRQNPVNLDPQLRKNDPKLPKQVQFPRPLTSLCLAEPSRISGPWQFHNYWGRTSPQTGGTYYTEYSARAVQFWRIFGTAWRIISWLLLSSEEIKPLAPPKKPTNEKERPPNQWGRSHYVRWLLAI